MFFAIFDLQSCIAILYNTLDILGCNSILLILKRAFFLEENTKIIVKISFSLLYHRVSSAW